MHPTKKWNLTFEGEDVLQETPHKKKKICIAQEFDSNPRPSTYDVNIYFRVRIDTDFGSGGS